MEVAVVIWFIEACTIHKSERRGNTFAPFLRGLTRAELQRFRLVWIFRILKFRRTWPFSSKQRQSIKRKPQITTNPATSVRMVFQLACP